MLTIFLKLTTENLITISLISLAIMIISFLWIRHLVKEDRKYERDCTDRMYDK